MISRNKQSDSRKQTTQELANINVSMITRSLSRSRGGIPPAVRALTCALHEHQGVNLSVLATLDDCTDEDIAAWKPIKPRLFKPRGPKSFNYLPGMPEQMERGNSDLIHAHGLWLYHSLATYRWAKKTGRPYVVSPHGMLNPVALENARWKKELIGRWYEKRNLHAATCLHALSEFEYESIRKFGLKNPVCVIPNGIGCHFETSDHKPWRNVIEPEKKVLLYLGRLHAIKGLPRLVRAFSKIVISGNDEWDLAIVGWSQDNHERDLRQLVNGLGIAKRVHFFDPQYDLEKHSTLRASNAVVLPSLSEAFPVTVLEAWIQSRPVAMSDAASIPEGFAANAAISLGSSTQSTVSGLEDLFAQSDAELKLMGQRGKKLVRDQFSWQVVSQKLRDVYDWLLKHKPAPDCVRFD